MARSPGKRPRLSRRVVAGARNALEVLRLGQLAPTARRPYEVVDTGPHARLRRYLDDGTPPGAPAVLLVPPLMVTADIYDVSADSSGVGTLLGAGVAPFVVDFGAPERQEGGMRRTLDDHVLGVSRAIDRVREIVGRDVHLAGYSQGGMFCYQAAAFRRSEGIASIITFGSPVDLHRSVPAVRSAAVGAFTRAIGPALSGILDRIEGLPAELTSTGFKLITPHKEIEQRIDFLRKLHDRGALERREARRRFLGGEGFVAWPGPALREFVEQFVVHNRMLSGGFVLGGRTATLADITCPVLAFLGSTDDLARPAAVRGIVRAAPDAQVTFVEVRAGHFGLVVGTRANEDSWPTVAAWVKHREGLGPPPRAALPKRDPLADEPEEAAFADLEVDADLLLDAVRAAASRGMRRAFDVAASAHDAALAVRHQLPRFRRLASMQGEDLVSPARLLARRARDEPTRTFFLWGGRAFSFGDADRRVDAVARGLASLGVRPGEVVGLWMGSRPSLLSAVTALSRLGAIAVVAPEGAVAAEVAARLREAGARRAVVDPERAAALAAADGGELLVLGGGARPRDLPPAAVDLEQIDPAGLAYPSGVSPDAGRARDVALILLRPRSGGAGRLTPVPLTNHRWALGAMGAAGACTLRPDDTVASFLPLHHPTTLIVAIGAALVAGCRLALHPTSPEELFRAGDVRHAEIALRAIRRTGATVVFYAGDLVRGLLRAPERASDGGLPVRLFAGSGMRASTWRAVERRWRAGVMEFYASTSLRLVLANASGEKRGALGRPIPGSAAVAVAALDPGATSLRRRGEHLVRARPGEEGLLLVELGEDEVRSRRAAGLVVMEGAFSKGDRWAPTNDVVRVDEAGDMWLVDALGGMVDTSNGEPVWARSLEGMLLSDPDVELAVVLRGSRGEVGAAVQLVPGAARDAYAERLRRAPPAGLDTVLVAGTVPMLAGFRCDRVAVAELLRDPPPDGLVVALRAAPPSKLPAPA